MSVQYMRSRLESMLASHNADLDALGEAVRADVIVPVCDRYGLDFVQGMGTYFFSKGKTTYGSADEATGALRRALEPIFELLNADATDRHPLGFRVGDYRHGSRRG